MRLPYAPTTPPPSSPASTQDIYTRIAARRHPRPLIPLDLALLHSPPVADGWNSLLGAIRSQTVLDKGDLELAVCRIAVLNGASWEWIAHAPLAIKGGVGRQVLEKVLGMPVLGGGETEMGTEVEAEGGNGKGENAEGGKQEVKGLSAKHLAILHYTDAMTRRIKVTDSEFDALKQHFNDREIVELTAAVAAYNCVSRFLVALDVGENNGREMVVPGE